jgi:hypothetical protein
MGHLATAVVAPQTSVAEPVDFRVAPAPALVLQFSPTTPTVKVNALGFYSNRLERSLKENIITNS